MGNVRNMFGSAPIAQPQRRGGGGGGNNNNNRNRNNGGGGGGGLGVGGNTGGGIPNTGFYTGDQGGAAANQDIDAFLRTLFGAAGQISNAGDPYSDYANTVLLQQAKDEYLNAQAQNQNLNPVDYFNQTYGAGWTTTPGEKMGKHGNHRAPGTTTFNAGTLPGAQGVGSDQYTDWYSNTQPLAYLNTKGMQGGAILPTGGNADFEQYWNKDFAPKIQAQLEAARAAGATSANPAYSAPAATTPNGMDTPVYALGGGNQGRHGHHRNRGNNGYEIPQVPGGGATTPAPTTPATLPISLNDFVQGRDLTEEGRQAYAFRPNSMRLPGPVNLAGHWSWWS